MVGRTPEYLGKKIGTRDIKLAAFSRRTAVSAPTSRA
nr:potassium-transporting ATPase subunit KdpA [Streptomyces sp. BK239]